MLKQNDPCPNVVLEALSCGLPVLYSASGGVPELVGTQAGIGLAVDEGFDEVSVPTPTAIAEGMAQIMQHREPMSQAARVRAVAHFDLSIWLDRHAALFAGLLGRTSTEP
jgi:glycosyltransferase involved in cell wall biosynthesis